ncbi:MAG: DUF565 domain-containing protein [Elainella sp.]
MQNTRLTTLISRSSGQVIGFFRNPWRRLSLLVIGFLGGNFLATLISTIAGQKAELDVIAAFLLVLIVEVASWLVYRTDRQLAASQQRLLFLELLNDTKLGLLYGMFVEAFKLGS